jgi:ubiquinone/menaquinone biosynthesis C-methylase UbiE
MADPKKIVESGYDQMAKRYMQTRRVENRDKTFLRLLFDRVDAGGKVLDLGCGSGIPHTITMAKRYKVIGVDLSQNQIDLARKNVPGAEFIKQDMTALTFPDETFDAVVSYMAILHVPREEKPGLYCNIFRMLKNGGTFMMMIGQDEWDSVPGDTLMETPMYWSQLGEEKTGELLESIGFRILRSSVETGELDGQPESHLLILAEKPQ